MPATATPSPARRLLLTAVAAVVGLTLWAVAPPAPAATRAMPGDFTGYAFDTCDTPSQRAMDRWRTHSRYAGIGIYVAGINRACSTQPNLTRRWVSTQARRGWRLLPLVVGRQASCSPPGYYRGKRISARPAGDYRVARAQGARSARTGAEAVRRLGIGRGSVVWFDLEGFDIGRTRCRRSAMAFTAAWTNQLHRLGYRSGLYSSASSGILMVDQERRKRGGRAVPDYLWIAEWNGYDNLRSSYIGRGGWWPHRRVHQFRGGHTERHGGVAINIDSNWMSTGRGTRAGEPKPHCGVRVNFRSYPPGRRGMEGPRIRAAKCFLRQQDHLAGRGRPGSGFGAGTARAVRRFQRDADLRVTGSLTRATWTALLARSSGGARRLVKVGSGGDAVRRVQRALNAATGARLRVDGRFGPGDLAAVRQYQRRTRRPATGVVTGRTWVALRTGDTVGDWSRRARPRRLAVPQEWAQEPYSSGARSPGWVAEHRD